MKRLLIVDDDPAILETLLDLLGDSYVVEGACDGAQALQRLTADPFDLVVLDLMMPVLDGVGLKRALDARQLAVPIILVSAARHLPSCAREIGAADWISKPFQVEALEEKIARVLGGGGAAPSGAPPDAPAGDVPVPSDDDKGRGTLSARRRPGGRTYPPASALFLNAGPGAPVRPRT